MRAGWTRRLENIFGEPLVSTLSARSIRNLVDAGAAEDEQLDFKRTRYARSEDGREEFAKDVCAFANHLGGALVLGVAETKGIASAALPLEEVGDADARHLSAVLASWSAPLPDIDVLLVPDDAMSGFVVVLVPPSPRRPHGVVAPSSGRFGYPIRTGTQTRWLTESEIADAYRARASRIADEEIHLSRLIDDGVAQLDGTGLWLVVAHVPAATSGGQPVDTALVARYESWLRENALSTLRGDQLSQNLTHRAGPRRVRFAPWMSNSMISAAGKYVELHTDGSGLVAVQAYQRQDNAGMLSGPEPGQRVVGDEWIAEFTLAAIHLLARHALDNAGAWAEGTATAVITDGQGLQLAEPVVVCHWRNFGFCELLPRTIPVETPASASVTIDIASVASDLADAIAAARLLGGGLINAFGHPELAQFTAEGAVRIRYFNDQSHQSVTRWSEQHGISLMTDLVG